MVEGNNYPIAFAVDYPDLELNRVSTLLRALLVIPMALLFKAVSRHVPVISTNWKSGFGFLYVVPDLLAIVSRDGLPLIVGGAGGLLALPSLVMIVDCQNYPRWRFDWNLELHVLQIGLASTWRSWTTAIPLRMTTSPSNWNIPIRMSSRT